MAVIIERMQVARGDAATWTAQNPTLMNAEWGLETDTRKMKIGDGATAWNALPYRDAAFAAAPLATGVATLVAGTKAVTGLASATGNTVVRLMNKTIGGTPGALYVSARTAGAGFTISSSSATDTSVVYYEVVSW